MAIVSNIIFYTRKDLVQSSDTPAGQWIPTLATAKGVKQVASARKHTIIGRLVDSRIVPVKALKTEVKEVTHWVDL